MYGGSAHGNASLGSIEQYGTIITVTPTAGADQIYATPTTDRTSLELLDFTLTYDKSTATYYTQWFPESRILPAQHDLGLIALVAPQAQEPAATVTVQYSDGGNAVAQESEPIQVDMDEAVHEIDSIPIDEDGYYRIQIEDYSGYNDLTNLNIGIVH